MIVRERAMTTPDQATEPITLAGKEMSRRNALKSGLFGAGIVLPDGLQAQVDEQERAFAAEYPQLTSPTERGVIRAMAWAVVRGDQALHQESRVTRDNQVRDLQLWDDQREKRALAAGARLAQQPAEARIELRGSAAGCVWMAERWEALDRALAEGWADEQTTMALDLLGIRLDERMLDLHALRITKLVHEMRSGASTADTAREELRSLVRVQIAELDERAQILFHSVEKLEHETLRTGQRFDTSPEARNLRSVQRAGQRDFLRCLAWVEKRSKGLDAGEPPLSRQQMNQVGQSPPTPVPTPTFPEFSPVIALTAAAEATVAPVIGTETKPAPAEKMNEPAPATNPKPSEKTNARAGQGAILPEMPSNNGALTGLGQFTLSSMLDRPKVTAPIHTKTKVA